MILGDVEGLTTKGLGQVGLLKSPVQWGKMGWHGVTSFVLGIPVTAAGRLVSSLRPEVQRRVIPVVYQSQR